MESSSVLVPCWQGEPEAARATSFVELLQRILEIKVLLWRYGACVRLSFVRKIRGSESTREVEHYLAGVSIRVSLERIQRFLAQGDFEAAQAAVVSARARAEKVSFARST